MVPGGGNYTYRIPVLPVLMVMAYGSSTPSETPTSLPNLPI